jgi:hypothetical protein
VDSRPIQAGGAPAPAIGGPAWLLLLNVACVETVGAAGCS